MTSSSLDAVTTPGPPPVRDVQGTVDDSFAWVGDVFARSVARQRVGGAALSVFVEGTPVIDLIGGTYRPDTLQQVFSVSKGIVAIAAALASAEGLIDLDQPLADYWSEFDRASTRGITPRSVLTHQSGIPAVDRVLSAEELVAGELDRAVEQQEPYWEPGTAQGYHSFTFGALLDGVFLRTVGERVGDFAARRLFAPLGLELSFGARPEQLHRLERVTFPPPVLTPAMAAGFSSPGYIADGSLAVAGADQEAFFARDDVRQASWPAMSVVGTARSLARLFAATLDDSQGVRLIDGETLKRATEPRATGLDRTTGYPTVYSDGFMLPQVHFPMLGRASFGHVGAGGSVAFADPERGLAFAYTTSAGSQPIGASDHALVLIDALRFAVDQRS